MNEAPRKIEVGEIFSTAPVNISDWPNQEVGFVPGRLVPTHGRETPEIFIRIDCGRDPSCCPLKSNTLCNCRNFRRGLEYSLPIPGITLCGATTIDRCN